MNPHTTPHQEKKVPLSEATHEEICRASAESHPEACDEELEYVIWFNRLSRADQQAEYKYQHP